MVVVNGCSSLSVCSLCTSTVFIRYGPNLAVVSLYCLDGHNMASAERLCDAARAIAYQTDAEELNDANSYGG